MTPRWVEGWLYFVALLVAGMVSLGGITRVTGSGLSIVEWDLLSGILPPLGDLAWERAFKAYQQTLQFQQVNAWMEIGDFRTIYWWEWLHRFAGRLIGVVYTVPLAYLLLRRALSPRLAARLLLLFALGALQGAVGWWMVRSGLGDRVAVAPLRLAVHLTLAFAILGLLLDTALLMRQPRKHNGPWGICALLVLLLLLQVASGALVAGSGAGRVYTDWPLFNGTWLPPLSMSLDVWLSDHALIQLLHRALGYLTVLVALWIGLASLSRVHDGARVLLLLLALAVWGQAALGVLTLIEAAPPRLALLHQAGAVLAFSLAVAARRWLAGAQRGYGRSADCIGI